jgi:hypothetical protein
MQADAMARLGPREDCLNSHYVGSPATKALMDTSLTLSAKQPPSDIHFLGLLGFTELTDAITEQICLSI